MFNTFVVYTHYMRSKGRWTVEGDEMVIIHIRVEVGKVPRKWTHVTFWEISA